MKAPNPSSAIRRSPNNSTSASGHKRKRHNSIDQTSPDTRRSARLQDNQQRRNLKGLKKDNSRNPLPSPSISQTLTANAQRLPRVSPASNITTHTVSQKSIEQDSCPIHTRKQQNTPGKEAIHRFDKEHIKDQQQGSPTQSSLGIPADGNPIEYWTKTNTWPRGYFDRSSKMSNPLTRKKSFSNRSLELQSSNTTSNDVPREIKSALYKNATYETHLASAQAFMEDPPLELKDTCKSLCWQLLDSPQATPKDSMFRDDVFKKTCSKIRNENEGRVIQDITRLIVPSAETLATFGSTELDILIEKVNSSWLKCLPLTKPRPQPDYSVGFRASAFTKDQLARLQPLIGEETDQCSVMSRWDVYFPFLTCEVKCGNEALNIADRQNMHSASVAVKGIVELFRRVSRQEPIKTKNVQSLEKIHQTVLAFSVSHDNETVRIYGHYALLDGDTSSFYRYPIHMFDIKALNGRDKWTAYKFTRNVYEIFAPIHLKRIRSAIDELPDPAGFDV